MGCDIHWFSETKQNDKWVCDKADSFTETEDDGTLYVDMDYLCRGGRDYWLFGLLQGVRTEWEWSFPQKINFPDDASEQVTAVFNQWGGDAHSEGCLTRGEIKAKIEELKPLLTKNILSAHRYSEALKHHFKELNGLVTLLDSDVPDTDQRIVFWFDS